MAFSEGDVFKAYDLYLQAGLYDRAHDLAVLELAPDAIYRWDHELLQSLFERFIGHPVDGWHDRGKVRKILLERHNPSVLTLYLSCVCRDCWNTPI
jgi:hypothetical protein